MATGRQTQPVWITFRMYGREFEWQVTDAPPQEHFPEPKWLHIRSVDGKLSIRATVVSEYRGWDRFKREWYTHRYWREGNPYSVIRDVEVLGVEFPLGCEYDRAKFDFNRGHISAKYGIIHTELVRSCIELWSHRVVFRAKRKKRRCDDPISN